MSFGTGHHATTELMMRSQLTIDHQGKKVYDFRSGIGVLAILASLLGASDITATDIDDWCIENSQENFELNNMNPRVLQDSVALLDLSIPADIKMSSLRKYQPM
jgi:ribosomal protein L11 methyltransferase